VRHISNRFGAVLDANVLYPFLVRDVLLSLADAGLYRPLWTERINHEWTRNLIEKRPEKAAQIAATVEVMNEAFPEALVGHYEDLIGGLQLPDANDCHVLAAAIRSKADVIVTDNTKDFPAPVLERYDLDARTADEFLLNTVELYPVDALAALKRMRLRYTNPPYTPDEMLRAMLRCGLVTTVASLTPHIGSL
jgi:predicted nucleic acid-binding protein